MIDIQISSDAVADLNTGYAFYESQEFGLGDYFVSQIRADIDGLKITAGIHRQVYRHLHRVICRKFPYAVFYEYLNHRVIVVAVVDCRRDPQWIKSHLKSLKV